MVSSMHAALFCRGFLKESVMEVSNGTSNADSAETRILIHFFTIIS